jgi:hypothetical protein
MKKVFVAAIALMLVAALAACGNDESKNGSKNGQNAPEPAGSAEVTPDEGTLINGGFETGDLTGWEVVEGDAFSDDVVATNKTFWSAEIPFNHEGNWHLYGLGFDETIRESKTGKLKSSTFKLGGDGIISMKIGAARDTERTYVAVHLAKNDEMIAKQANTEFADPGVADKSKYEAGLGFTNNYAEYKLDLSRYLGEEMYIMIVDGDDDGDFGFINVDDIRTYYVNGVAEPQAPGEIREKKREYILDVEAPSPYEIANAGFETGSLGGWTIEGDAFDHAGVTDEETWWAEKIPYNRDGNYHFGMYNEAGTGKLTSTTFELGGSGWITFKLGGGKDVNKMYISVYDAETGAEIARYGNTEFADVNFPNIDQGMRLANLVQYKANLSEHIGKKLYIQIVDDATQDWGLMTFDSFFTKHDTVPQDGVEAKNLLQ